MFRSNALSKENWIGVCGEVAAFGLAVSVVAFGRGLGALFSSCGGLVADGGIPLRSNGNVLAHCGCPVLATTRAPIF